MSRALPLILALMLSGCAAAPPLASGPSACDGGNENAWDCQVERYGKVSVP